MMAAWWTPGLYKGALNHSGSPSCTSFQRRHLWCNSGAGIYAPAAACAQIVEEIRDGRNVVEKFRLLKVKTPSRSFPGRSLVFVSSRGVVGLCGGWIYSGSRNTSRLWKARPGTYAVGVAI
jgi:hypothetical protein